MRGDVWNGALQRLFGGKHVRNGVFQTLLGSQKTAGNTGWMELAFSLEYAGQLRVLDVVETHTRD